MRKWFAAGSFGDACGARDEVVDVERRLDPHSGEPYTYADFLDFYGEEFVERKWSMAVCDDVPLNEVEEMDEADRELDVERRLDPHSGDPYTYDDFLDFYGEEFVERKWSAAATQESVRDVERRVDPHDGDVYTFQEFVDCYGADHGERKWSTAVSDCDTDARVGEAIDVKRRSGRPPVRHGLRERSRTPLGSCGRRMIVREPQGEFTPVPRMAEYLQDRVVAVQLLSHATTVEKPKGYSFDIYKFFGLTEESTLYYSPVRTRRRLILRGSSLHCGANG